MGGTRFPSRAKTRHGGGAFRQVGGGLEFIRARQASRPVWVGVLICRHQRAAANGRIYFSCRGTRRKIRTCGDHQTRMSPDWYGQDLPRNEFGQGQTIDDDGPVAKPVPRSPRASMNSCHGAKGPWRRRIDPGHMGGEKVDEIALVIIDVHEAHQHGTGDTVHSAPREQKLPRKASYGFVLSYGLGPRTRPNLRSFVMTASRGRGRKQAQGCTTVVRPWFLPSRYSRRYALRKQRYPVCI